MLLGIVFHKQKNYEQSKALFERALSLGGEFANRKHIYHFLGWANFYLGRLEDAKTAFEEHIRLAPGEGDSYFGLGVVEKDLNHLPEAKVHFQKAIELQQANPKRQQDVAKSYARLGEVFDLEDQPIEAERNLRLAVTMYPELYEAWFMLERLYRRLDRQDEADRCQQMGTSARQTTPAGWAANHSRDDGTSYSTPRSNDRSDNTGHSMTARFAPTFFVPAAVLCLACCLTCLASDTLNPPPSAQPAATPSNPLHFTTLAAHETGLDITLTSGNTPSTQVLEVKGGGLGLIDFDNDGDQDVFIPNGATFTDPERGPGARLFENIGELKFRDVTGPSGIKHTRWSFGVAIADYDGDGLDDIYICCFGPDVLLRNKGGGIFEDVTAAAGLGDGRWSTAASWGDLDNDGDLDLYLVNYLVFDAANPPPSTVFKGIPVMAGPFGMAAADDCLYENLGNGAFRDVSESSGIAGVKAAYGLNAVILDFDSDGKQDIFVGNDSQPNHLFHNLGSLKFEEVARKWGLATNREGTEQATMGVAIGDVDGNGRSDIYTTVFSSDTNTLRLNMNGRFLMIELNSPGVWGFPAGSFSDGHAPSRTSIVTQTKICLSLMAMSIPKRPAKAWTASTANRRCFTFAKAVRSSRPRQRMSDHGFQSPTTTGRPRSRTWTRMVTLTSWLPS